MTHDWQQKGSPRKSLFESEPADEWREEYARGGPVRSNEPERDYFFEDILQAPSSAPRPSTVHLIEPVRQTIAPSRRPAVMSYRGRGPKHYQPTDERLLERICEALADSHEVDATDITVLVEAGIVTLEGNVLSYAMSQAAEALVRSIYGVKQVQNRLSARNQN